LQAILFRHKSARSSGRLNQSTSFLPTRKLSGIQIGESSMLLPNLSRRENLNFFPGEAGSVFLIEGHSCAMCLQLLSKLSRHWSPTVRWG
jgi:hypothetical protein